MILFLNKHLNVRCTLTFSELLHSSQLLTLRRIVIYNRLEHVRLTNLLGVVPLIHLSIHLIGSSLKLFASSTLPLSLTLSNFFLTFLLLHRFPYTNDIATKRKKTLLFKSDTFLFKLLYSCNSPFVTVSSFL